MAFYRDGLGLDVQGAPANADANPALRNMFGLPDAQLRWLIGRPAGMRTGVEMVEITKAEGKPLERRVQDSGAFMLIAIVRDLDAAFARLKQLGAPVVTRGGAPIPVPAGAKSRAVIVKDPDGHFVELFQPDPVPDSPAPATSNVIEVRVRLTVTDGDRAARLYRDALGLQVRAPGEFRKDRAVLDMMGLSGGEYRAAMFTVPTTGLTFEIDRLQGRGSPLGARQHPGPRLDADPAPGPRRGRGHRRAQAGRRRRGVERRHDGGPARTRRRHDQGRHRAGSRQPVPRAAAGGRAGRTQEPSEPGSGCAGAPSSLCSA